MREGVWRAYTTLQEESGSVCATADPIAVTGAADAFRAIRGGLQVQHALAVGPGGALEPIALRAAFGCPVTVLTVDPREAASLADQFAVVVTDLHDTALPAASFDFIVARNVLEHAFAPYIALMELRRVARAGCTLHALIPTFNGPEGGRGPYHVSCLAAELWEELLRKTGWGTARVAFDGVDGVGYWAVTAIAGDLPEPHGGVLDRLRAVSP